MDVCLLSVVCCEGRGLCDEIITRSEESYRLCCVVVCDLETSLMRRSWPTGVRGGGTVVSEEKNCIFTVYGNIFNVLLTMHLATASQHKRMTIPTAVYTEKYFLMMSSKPARNMLRLITEIN
jgi:hypothetical protein